ncbi:DUF4190 domain-containing protein [Nocardia uniformis]|uniref:DUF4190 domain-containing protein n=1 Tax=Nocardia uniformis TaxID=53432 RepID=A0A849C5D1_9NOCA|nr:DUF4190 domain-containing protein [Nocardia uniformis]NNH73904.1 DUF4190 domain-containing protein [Nocardia uniformis]
MSYPPPGQYPPPGGYPEQPGGYPQQPGQQYWQEPQKGKGLAITALVLGIIALLFCWTVIGGILFGVLAAIFGLIALLSKKAGGTGLAITGLILGIIGLIIAVIIGVVAWGFLEETGFTDFTDCVNKANGDQTKIEQCESDFQRRVEDKFSITLTPEPTP